MTATQESVNEFRKATAALAAAGLTLAWSVNQAGVSNPTSRAYDPLVRDAVLNLERREAAYLEAYTAVGESDPAPADLEDRTIAAIRGLTPVHANGGQ